MIRITKGITPVQLLELGKIEVDSMLEKYKQKTDSYDSGHIKFSFDPLIYKLSEVKKHLSDAQNIKCCYTEAHLEGEPSIEHYRPKGSFRNDKGCKRYFPGYFWLAYSWSNLFLSNSRVNTIKNDFFPLSNPDVRSRSIQQGIQHEKPLLVNPELEDPRGHIVFHRDVPVGITPKGKKTIEILGLRDVALREMRMRRLRHLEILLLVKRMSAPSRICPISPENMEKVEAELTLAVTPVAEFSSMAIDLIEMENSRTGG